MKIDIKAKTEKTERRSTKMQKKLFIEALIKSLGNVTKAARIVDKKDFRRWRRRHYLWITKDKKYKESVEDVIEISLDFAEDALIGMIEDGNFYAIKEFLAARGKARGYGKTEERGTKSDPIVIEILEVDTPKNKNG